jgi:hypothetical protein
MKNLILCFATMLAFAGCVTNDEDPGTTEASQEASFGFCRLVQAPLLLNRSCLGKAVGSNCLASRPGQPTIIGVCQDVGQLPPSMDPFDPPGGQFICFCKDGPLVDS